MDSYKLMRVVLGMIRVEWEWMSVNECEMDVNECELMLKWIYWIQILMENCCNFNGEI